MYTVKELEQTIKGPVVSINTAFNKDGSIDFKGVHNFIETAIDNDSSALVLTHGDSLYRVLTDNEVYELTKFTTNEINGRVPLIAADKMWWTGEEIKFARFCKETGVDCLMVNPPEWGASTTTESVYNHYLTVAKEIPITCQTGFFKNFSLKQGIEIIDRLIEESNNVAAVKLDCTENYDRRFAMEFADRLPVIQGGQKELFLNVYPYGVNSYFSTFLMLAPKITWKFWNHVKNNEMKEAGTMAKKYDNAFFELGFTFKGGFDTAFRAMLEIAGIQKRYRRSPFVSITDSEMEKFKDFLRDVDII